MVFRSVSSQPADRPAASRRGNMVAVITCACGTSVPEGAEHCPSCKRRVFVPSHPDLIRGWLFILEGDDAGTDHRIKGDRASVGDVNRGCGSDGRVVEIEHVNLTTRLLHHAGDVRKTFARRDERFLAVERELPHRPVVAHRRRRSAC